ncbi:MAG: hypothetical protein NWE77_08900 [Candidatus Bathyarchaeota archaeon]|nr:hypothetical protein [Candidatus Bathyarchaeota archaeon]
MRKLLLVSLLLITLIGTVSSAFQVARYSAEADSNVDPDVGATTSSINGGDTGEVSTDVGPQVYSDVSNDVVANTPPFVIQQGRKTVSYIVVELKNVTIHDDSDPWAEGEIEMGTVAMSGKGVTHVLSWPILVEDSSWYEADDGNTIIVDAPIFCQREDEMSDVLAVFIVGIDNDEIPEWLSTFADIWFGLGQTLSGLIPEIGPILEGALQLEEIGVDALLEYLGEPERLGLHGNVLIPSDWKDGYLAVEEKAGDMTVRYEIRRIQVPVRTPPISVKLLNVKDIDIDDDDGWGDYGTSEPFIHTRVLDDLTAPEQLIQTEDFGPVDKDTRTTWTINKEIFRVGAIGPFLHVEIDVWEEDNPSGGDDNDMLGIYSHTFYPDENWGIGSTIVERRSGLDEGDVRITFEIIGLPFYNVGVSLSPASLEVEPGYTETYTVTVTNLGNLNDTYDLSLNGLAPSWYAFSEQSISLAPSESTQVMLNVTPTRHWSTAPGDYDFTVTATSINDSEATDYDYGKITVLPFHETQLFVVPDSFWAQPGDTVTYTIGVQNLGNVRDDYNVSAEFVNPGGLFIDPRWTTIWPYVFWGLDPGSTGTGYLEISVPEDWAATGLEEATYTFTVFAVCQADPTATDEATRTLNVMVGTRTLSITLSGEFDYAFKEPVTIKILALVKDIKSRQPISNADVNIEIYAPNGDLLWSDQMVEMENGNGVYIWESEETIQDIMKGPHWQPFKGVYTVCVEASYNAGPIAYEALEFHIDPPAESSSIPSYYPAVAIIVCIAALVAFRQLYNRRVCKPKVQ